MRPTATLAAPARPLMLNGYGSSSMRTSYTDGVALRAPLPAGLSQSSKSLFSIPLASFCNSNECTLVTSIDHARVSFNIGLFQ